MIYPKAKNWAGDSESSLNEIILTSGYHHLISPFQESIITSSENYLINTPAVYQDPFPVPLLLEHHRIQPYHLPQELH